MKIPRPLVVYFQGPNSKDTDSTKLNLRAVFGEEVNVLTAWVDGEFSPALRPGMSDNMNDGSIATSSVRILGIPVSGLRTLASKRTAWQVGQASNKGDKVYFQRPWTNGMIWK